MNSVWLAGRGLASALGPDLPSAIDCLARGGTAVTRVPTILPGSDWPYFAIADAEPDWRTRARRIVRDVAAQAGANADRRSALYLASSSFDIGAIEAGDDFLSDAHAFAEEVAGWLGWQGPVFAVSTACTSSLNAVLCAQAQLRIGDIDGALVLGMELFNRFSIAGFDALQLLASDAPRPCGAARDGLVLGEAIAALYLTTKPSRWRVAGGANVVDGSNPAGATTSAVALMCREALADAAIAPDEVDLIKLHAAGSPSNDAVELDGLAMAFPMAPPRLSYKSALGHTLGASGAAEVALLTEMLESGTWFPPNYAQDAALGRPLAEHRPVRVHYALANILGFGGSHTALVLEDCECGT